MNKLNVLVTILNIFIAISSYYLAKKQYLENQKKNSIEIIPMFDIDISRIGVIIDFNLRLIRFTIPLFNLGNGIATEIDLEDSKGFINNGIIVKYGYTNYFLEKNLSYNINEIYFKIKFHDLNGKEYEQKFKIIFDISNKIRADFLLRTSIINPQNCNEIIHVHILKKYTQKI